MHQLWPSRHYSEQIPVFREMTYYKVDHQGYHHNQDGARQKLYILYLVRILVAGFVIFGEVLKFFFFKDTILRCSSNINLESSISSRCFLDVWETVFIKHWRMMIYSFCFATKNYFLSLFSRVCVKVHFPLIGPVVYYFQILIEIVCRCFECHVQQKTKKYHDIIALHW